MGTKGFAPKLGFAPKVTKKMYIRCKAGTKKEILTDESL